MKQDKASLDHIPVFETVQTGNIDVWMAACGTIFSAAPLNHQESDQYIAQSWFIDPIMVGFSQYHSMVSKHAEGHIQDSGRHLNVHRYVSKEKVALDSDGIPLLFERGSIGLLDYSRPFTTIHPDSECHSFIIPHGAVGYAPSDRPHAMLLPPNSTIEHRASHRARDGRHLGAIAKGRDIHFTERHSTLAWLR